MEPQREGMKELEKHFIPDLANMIMSYVYHRCSICKEFFDDSVWWISKDDKYMCNKCIDIYKIHIKVMQSNRLHGGVVVIRFINGSNEMKYLISCSATLACFRLGSTVIKYYFDRKNGWNFNAILPE